MDKKEASSLELLKLQKEIWEKAVDTQMHFNEMSAKSRQLGLTFVVAALGVAVVLLGKEKDVLWSVPIPFLNVTFGTHIAAIVVLIAALGLYGVRRLDLDVYHRMLRGAVKFGEELEGGALREHLMKTPNGMTELVSLYSRFSSVVLQNGKYVGQGKMKTAAEKIKVFYRWGYWALGLLAFFLGYLYHYVK